MFSHWHRLNTFAKAVAMAAALNALPAQQHTTVQAKTFNGGVSIGRAAGFKVAINAKPALTATAATVTLYCP
jgi:hypothetical protein